MCIPSTRGIDLRFTPLDPQNADILGISDLSQPRTLGSEGEVLGSDPSYPAPGIDDAHVAVHRPYSESSCLPMVCQLDNQAR